MKRAKTFIDDLAEDAPPAKKQCGETPGFDPDDIFDLEEAMEAIDEEAAVKQPKSGRSRAGGKKATVAPPKKGRPINSACVEMLPGETLDEAGGRHAADLERGVLHENTAETLGFVYPYIMPENADSVYRKKKLAAFGITITLPVKVAGQFTGRALYANAAVMTAFKQVCDVFQVQKPDGMPVSNSKKQYRAFLKQVDGNPQYRKVEMKGAHAFDCIRKTKFYPAMEVQPGAQTLLHVQAHLEVYYFYDGHFFHVESQELTRIFESMGYEWARVHVEFKTTQVYDSKQYIRIPPGKKTRDYWEKKTAWKDKAPVKLTKGSFDKTVYLEDDD